MSAEKGSAFLLKAGDYNGERTHALALESSGAVDSI